MVRVCKLPVALAVLFSLGLHWSVLQSVAWVGMLINYSRSDSFAEAVTKTFDGNHPCKLCKVVEEGRQAEKKQEATKTETKLELALVAESARLEPPPAFSFALNLPLAAASRSETPPVPPPRAV
jgi:hypothetical protein